MAERGRRIWLDAEIATRLDELTARLGGHGIDATSLLRVLLTHEAKTFSTGTGFVGRWARRLDVNKAKREAEARARIPKILPRDAGDLAHLGLSWPCTAADVERARRLRALVDHPDRNGSNKAMVATNAAADNLIELIRLGGRR